MRTENFHMEQTDDGIWTYFKQRSAGDPHKAPLHEIMPWVLEQLNFGNVLPEVDEKGDVVSLTLGRRAAPECESFEEAAEHANRRPGAVNVAGVLARCREEGTEPQHRDLISKVHLLASEGAYTNAEFHYAFELVRVLARIRNLTFFLFDIEEDGSMLFAPLVEGKASPRALWYLGEATRCYLYGLHRGCIVLSRACLEESLSTKLTTQGNRARDAMKEHSKQNPEKGELERMIDVASSVFGSLDKKSTQRAHYIRKRGNDIVHRRSVKEEESRTVLSYLRSGWPISSLTNESCDPTPTTKKLSGLLYRRASS